MPTNSSERANTGAYRRTASSVETSGPKAQSEGNSLRTPAHCLVASGSCPLLSLFPSSAPPPAESFSFFFGEPRSSYIVSLTDTMPGESSLSSRKYMSRNCCNSRRIWRPRAFRRALPRIGMALRRLAKGAPCHCLGCEKYGTTSNGSRLR
ncbi:hypothetical protein VTN77DRAFT_7310 [Rasamsonia byssochlamydoides]|uniref:uncharacterized protein n=1 Tax=Rasamsonia byssochlamydoides TaxID=89139 RepID=UPI00374474CB